MNDSSLVHARAGALLLAAAAALVPLTAQDPAPPPAPPPVAPAEWPVLKDTDKDKVRALAGQFRKDDPALHERARQQLVAMGAGAAPVLMQLVSDRAEARNEPLFAVLDELLVADHAPLLARETKKQVVALRRYLSRRLCRFGDPAMVPVLTTLRGDADPQTAFHAQLALFAAGQRDALAPVLAYTKANWNEVAPLLADVLPKARSRAMGDMVFEAIAKAPKPDQAYGLRLLRHLAVDGHRVVLRTYLDASDHTVKREAVNTARALHGEAPIDNLSVFQTIEMAKAWLQKL